MSKKREKPVVEVSSFAELEVEQFTPFVPNLTPNQEQFLKTIQDKAITFCLGPSATGKTMIACYYAAGEILAERCKKIIGVRPMVECGRKMGFIPGGEEEKLAPYLRPIDAKLKKFIPLSVLSEMKKKGAVEYRTINTMRGDEFEDSIVILDEAQNLDVDEMMMFVTRLGVNSKMIICGDEEQKDITFYSGLSLCFEGIKPDRYIGFARMTEDDMFRNPALKAFLKQYKQAIKNRQERLARP